MWFVDGKPFRVFENKGGSFPRQAVSIIGTIWNGTWASNGAPVNWNDGPFVASYRGFGVTACPTHSIDDPQCKDSSNYWWNAPKYASLDPLQKKLYHEVRSKYMVYDYCAHNPIPECHGGDL
ncbi:xyloglucan endotransglucosylase/hydrolase protein 3-like [Neltuma alba]|uniref:xyloglucan endotransglucosylase/hydrolase protein 3-like n=1 Tax=Neltuma alba TaxID=207710 RepID=UPI0010A55D89|nr:xyloglucan endotransglucosylase/hydrolase protein 3-like [Prosopis alba]